MIMARRLVPLLWLALAPALPAQAVHRLEPRSAAPDTGRIAPVTPAATGAPGTINGEVYDSLHARPLAGATVVVAGATVSATTDRNGRFSIPSDSVPEGNVTFGFFHPLLDSLEISPPPRTVSVHHGTSTFVTLGVPSMTTIVRAVCPDSTLTDGRGAVLGVVRDADTEKPLTDARVVLTWTAVSVLNTTVLRLPKAASGASGDGGFYRVCGVPSGIEVTAHARVGERASGSILLSVPPGGFSIQHFLVPPTPPAAGAAVAAGQPAGPTSTLAGTVVGAARQPLEGAEVSVIGSPLTARSDAKGTFRLSGLPPGTRSAEVRYVGYTPRRYAVSLLPNRTSQLHAILDEKAQVLEPVVTTASPSDIPGFDQRRQRGLGTYLTEEQIKERGVVDATDVLRGIPGVMVSPANGGYVVQMTRNANVGCPVQYYLDGSPFGSAGDINDIVRPQDILAIEVYKGPTETPVEFQTGTNSSCGVIVIWTKRGHFTPKKTTSKP